MIRATFIASVLLSLASSIVFADAAPDWRINAKATQANGNITVSIELSRTVLSDEALPPGAKGPVMQTSSQKSTILIRRGQFAIMVSSNPSAKPHIALGNTSAESADNVDSITDGIKVEVISVKDQDTVVVVATSIENSQVIWAQAQTIEATPLTQPAK